MVVVMMVVMVMMMVPCSAAAFVEMRAARNRVRQLVRFRQHCFRSFDELVVRRVRLRYHRDDALVHVNFRSKFARSNQVHDPFFRGFDVQV